MCYLVAPLVCLPVLHPRGVPGLERPNPECEAEVERQLACRVPCVGARSITSAGPAPWRPGARDRAAACAPPARRGAVGGRAKRSRPAGPLRQPYEAWWSSRLGICRSPEVRSFLRPRPIGRNLDDGAVQRHRRAIPKSAPSTEVRSIEVMPRLVWPHFRPKAGSRRRVLRLRNGPERHRLPFDAHDPLPLQLLEHRVEHPALRPAVHAHVDGVPSCRAGAEAPATCSHARPRRGWR